MNPRDYDRIADLLMQIRSKYENLLPTDPSMKATRLQMIDSLNFLIQNNDLMGQWDSKGWL